MKYIFKAFNIFVGILWMLSICSLDSESWIPTVVCAVAALYLGFVAYLTERMGDAEGEEE